MGCSLENFIRSVTRFIDNGFFKKRWGTHLDMNIRYFNIVIFLLSFFTAIFSIFIGIYRKTYEVPLVLVIASVFFLLIYFLGNKTKRYNFYMILSTYAFNLVFARFVLCRWRNRLRHLAIFYCRSYAYCSFHTRARLYCFYNYSATLLFCNFSYTLFLPQF